MFLTVRIFLSYAKANALSTAVIFYLVFSSVLDAYTGIDICIPCIFRTITGYTCPGCGLTSAVIELLKLNPLGAWDENPLIFIILPAGAWWITRDFLVFRNTIS
jgi:hypothetical protein